MTVTSIDPRALLRNILASAGCPHQWERLPAKQRIVCTKCGLFAYETSRANLSADLGDTGLTSRSNLTGPYLDDLLHPADAFPIRRKWLPIRICRSTRRAILASLASDACSVEAPPSLRPAPAGRVVTFQEIMDALKELDVQARQGMNRGPSYRRWIRHETFSKTELCCL